MEGVAASAATIADEQQALTLEGGTGETAAQPPRLTGHRRLAAAAAAFGALAALGIVAYFAAGSRDAAPAPAATPAAAAEDAVQLFGGDAVCGQCQCNCAWVSSPNSCIPQANDGGCCWSCCCHSYAGDRGYEVHTDGGYAYGEHTVVVHHQHYYGGSGHHHVVHYHEHSEGMTTAMLWWIVLWTVLLTLGCIGLYCFYFKKP